jgi:membrane-associated protein
VMRMSYPRFLAFNAAGCILWTTVFTTVGYLFGRHLPLLEKYIREIGIAAAVLAVIAIAVFFARRRQQRTNKEP